MIAATAQCDCSCYCYGIEVLQPVVYRMLTVFLPNVEDTFVRNNKEK